MSAGAWNTSLERGASFSRTLTWKDGAGTPVNLTGYTAHMQLRKRVPSATDVALDLTTANSRIVLGGTAGTILLSVLAADTLALAAGTYVYDLKMTSPGSPAVVTRLVSGLIVVSDEVTQ